MGMRWKAKVTSKGQITIPADIRKSLHIEEGDYLVFEAPSEYGIQFKVQKTESLTSLQGALKAKGNMIHSEIDMKKIRRDAYDQMSQEKHIQQVENGE